jgi:hypothetical protein
MSKLISKEFRMELEDYLQEVAKFAKRVGKTGLLHKTADIFDRLQGDCETVDSSKKMCYRCQKEIDKEAQVLKINPIILKKH